MVTLRQLQEALLSMLIDIDEVCKEKGIKYSLASGTALGAVRHQGFIPWDDDLDILMVRDQYDKFIKVAPESLKTRGYTVQKDFSPEWPMTYAKVRKDHTTYIENYSPKIENAHQGIFIDVFPIDNLSDNEFHARLQWGMFELLVAKTLKKRGYKTDSIVKKFVMGISGIFPEQAMKEFVINNKEGHSRRVHCFLGAAVHRERNIFNRNDFSEYIDINFENHVFPIMTGYDDYLSVSYGDYMKLPPENERSMHMHASIIDLKHSYTELLDEKNKDRHN